jgi:hypothetical protein
MALITSQPALIPPKSPDKQLTPTLKADDQRERHGYRIKGG